MKKHSTAKLAALEMLAALGLLWVLPTVEAKKDNLPRLPGAMLLVGDFDTPTDLAVTAGDGTSRLHEGGERYVAPSISADGRIVASAHSVPSDPPSGLPRLIVSTYSMAEKRWGDHEGFEVRGGTVAISPDGSKLACNFMATPPSLLHILDLKTGKVTVGPETTKDADNPSWSPDGRRIAFAKEVERRKNGLLIPPLRAVYVLDVEAGTVSKIADGGSPSWSPSGEWIAFYGYSPRPPNDGKGGGYDVGEDLLSLVRPDGTRSKVLRGKLPDRELPPIWSPDSTTILMNRPQQDSVNPKVDVYLLDIATLKLTKKFKMVPPVYGWVAAK